jgi:hypothetical protein
VRGRIEMELGKVIVIIVIASVLVSGLMPVVCSRDPGNEADVIYVIEPKTLDRDSEPVVVTVNRIPAFAGYDVDDIYVWANRNNAWQQVVFQIDEVNGTFMRKDNPVVSSGPHKNYYIPDNGVMDSDDEIVFMANETGDRVNAGTWPPGTDHNISRYEITVTDPLTGNKGWAYLYYDDTNPAWTTVDYGSWTESSNYLDIYGYSLNYNDDDEHMLYYTEMNVDPNIGGTDVDIVDRNKRFVHLDVTMEPRRDEEGNCARNGLETYYSGLDNDPQYNHEYAIKDGPVRVIRHLRWGFGNANFFNDPTDKMGWRVAEEYKYYPSMYTEDEFIRHQSGTTYGEHYYRSIDHTAAAGAMAYYNSNSGTGTVNGNPADDTVTSPLLTWDQISSSHGSYITTYNISSFSGEGTCPCIKTTRWIDDSGFSETADGETRQNAEAGRYGEHGIDFVRGSPCTTYTWQTGHFYYKTYFLGADAPNIGEEYWNYSDTPLSITSPVPALQSWKDDVDPPATVAGTVLVEGVASYSVPVTAAGNVQLTGTVDETGHGGHNISSAVWTNGFANFPGTSMNAVDGTYNEITENVVCTINLAGWTAGTYEIYIYGSDDKGNQNTTSTEHATITITDNLPPATQTGSVLAGGLASYSVPFSAAGPIDLTATIDDNNRGNSDIISAVWTDGFANFPGTAMSASDGLFDSYTEAVTWTLPLDTWDAGIYDLYVYGTDASPLQNTTSTQHATVTIIDDVPPQITNALLEGQAVYSMGFSHDAFLTLTATVDDSTTGNTVIGGANFTMGAQMWASSQAMGAVTPLDSSVEDFSYLLNVSDWAPGTYFLYVYGWDSTSVFNTTSMAFATLIITNTWAPETQNVLVDGVPEVSVPFSARGTVTLTATIDDTNHGDDIIAGANYTNGKVNWPGVDMTPDTPLDSVTENFTAIVDVSDWPVGTYDLYVYGWDIQNDCNSSSTEFGRIIIYDDVAPQISDVNINGVSVFETDNVAAGTITLTARVNDTLTGNSLIGGAEYTIGAQNWPGVGMTPDSPLNTPDETFTQVVDVSSWSSGVYYLYVYGWDIVSVYNSTSQAFATLIIHDVLAPEINNVRINGSFTHNVNYASATTVVLTAEVDDTGRGDSEIGGANYSDGFINWPTSAPMSTYNDEALADILIIGTVSSDDYSAPNDFLNTAQFPDDNRYEHIQEDGSAGGPTTFYFESFETGLGVWTADNGAELARRQIGVDPLFYLGPGTVTPDGSYFIDFNDQNNVNDWIYMSSGIDMSTATANREIEFWYDPQDMDDGTETVDYSVYHDGAWSALTTIPSQNDGDFVNDAMADWTQNSPIIVDLETYGITDWTDIRLRFQSDSQWEATDEVVVDSITFRGDAPSTILEHRWQFDMGSNPTFYVDASNPAGSDSGFRFQWSDDAGLNWFEFSTPLVFNPGEEDVLKSSSIALPSYEDYFLVRVISDTPGPVVDTFSVDRMWAEGQFNNNPELVYATIDISGWQPGVYDLYVYAWDKSPQYNVTSTAHATLIIDDNLPPEIYNFLVNGVKSVTLNLSEGPITLTGTVDDTNTGNSIIKGAGFTDGYQNWNVSGGMVNDTPLDSPVETFTNVTPIYNFSAGIHRLFMYGGDVTGMNNDTSTENVTVTIIDDVPPATLNYTTLANGLSQLTLDPALTTTFTLNATISDVFFGYSNITAANWTAGPANWSAGHDLASADGTWDNSTENVTGTIDITGWPTGTYFIYVYGTDEWGNGQTLVPTYAVLHVDGIGPAITGPWADNQNPYVWETDTSFLLTAYGDDRERGYSDVVAAEYFVDAVGANGTGTPMSPMGFRFDSPYEGARATVSLVGWTPGEYHTYYVHFKDAMDHWGDVDSVFVMYNSSFSIPIHLGWNLISIPLVTPTTDLTDILSDIPNGWDYAMTYVLSPGGGYWISTSIYRPDTVNNFTYVDNTMAFWLHVTDVYDGFLDVIGAPPVSTTIDLYAGWNFIGYPTLDNTKTIADAFSTITYDSVEGYSGTDPYRLQVLPSTYVMQPGEGYWVKVPFDQTWIVNW